MADNGGFFGKFLGGGPKEPGKDEKPEGQPQAPKPPTPPSPPRPPVAAPAGPPRPVAPPSSAAPRPPAGAPTPPRPPSGASVAAKPPSPSVHSTGIPSQSSVRAGEAQRADSSEGEYSINDLLNLVVEKGGSDLHLTVNSPPMMRVQGRLWPADLPPMTPKDTRRLIYEFLTNDQRERFDRDLELDISYEIFKVARFRCNIFMNRLGMGGVFRVIPTLIKSLQDLKLPAILGDLARRNKGLVLVTGPTGSGKSTTLAAMVDLVNNERQEHILTVEDPIEFVHEHKRCIVNQRELGVNTKSFANALRAALREDPNVILVGEMRDFETISLAVTAAETGHLVFATLHTPSAPQSIERIVDVFPSHQQEQIRTQLADALVGIVSQQLIPTVDGTGRMLAIEILVNTPAVSNLIRENKTFQLHSIMQTSKQQGMQTMDQSLTDLMKSRKITPEDAYRRAFDKKSFDQYKPR